MPVPPINHGAVIFSGGLTLISRLGSWIGCIMMGTSGNSLKIYDKGYEAERFYHQWSMGHNF
jgi:hypothetical protein